MTTFAEYLVAASSLSSGTVWDLITHPRTGGTGTVVNNGATAVIADNTMAVALADSSMEVTIAPSITVQITTQPIGATA